MREPFTLSELAELAEIGVAELEAYVDAGLLDADGDGLLDEFDALRVQLVVHYRTLGYSQQDVIDGVPDMPPLHAELLSADRAALLTLEEAASRSGLSTEQITALRTATSTPGGLLQEFEVELLSVVARVVAEGMPWGAVIEAARVYGDAMKRLAATEVRIMGTLTESLESGEVAPRDRSERLQRFIEMFQPIETPLLVHLHRQHLLRAMATDNLDRLAADGGSQREATILFVDLASFTPLAQVHGDEVAADVLNRFDTLVRDLAVSHDGGVVKQIGDAFMLTFREQSDALRFAIALDESIDAEYQFPAIRIGVHSGPVLYRVGDFVGNTVNLAARVAAMAAANEILVTKPVAAVAVEEDLPVEPAGEREIKGVDEPIALYRIVRTGGRARRRERDPVCGMLVGASAAARLLHGGYEFVFCSQDCLRRFLEHPARYTPAADAPKPIL